MELKKAIEQRRSVREFSIETVPKKAIEDLIDCARMAPSACNRQNWYFVVLETEKKDKVAEILMNQFQKDIKNMEPVDSATKPYRATNSLINSARIIKEAPILILVFRNKSEDWLEGDYLSIGCAVEHICLRAVDIGLASLWVRDVIYCRKEVSKLVNFSEKELVTGVAIGYSTEYPYQRKKKALDEIIRWI